MKRYYLIILYLVVFLLMSCDSSYIDSNELMYDTIKIKITNEQLAGYPFGNSFEENNTYFYAGYNPFTSRIDFFDLHQNEFSHSIQLEEGGPNSTLPFFAFTALSSDSVILIDQSSIKLINEHSQIIQNITLRKDVQGIDLNKFFFGVNPHYGLFKSNNNLFLPIMCENKLLYNYQDESWSPLFSLDVNTYSGSHLPIHIYQFIEEEVNYFSDKSEAVVSQFNNDKLVIGFSFTPDVGIYDLKTGLVEITKVDLQKSDPFNVYDENLNENAFLRSKYYREEPHYFNIIFDKSNGLFYRLYHSGWSANESINDVLFLSIYNDKFELISSIQIKQRVYPSIEPYNSGVLIPFREETFGEDTLAFLSVKKFD